VFEYFVSWGLFFDLQETYYKIFFGSVAGFLLGYFALASGTFLFSKLGMKIGFLKPVGDLPIVKGQITREITLSVVSIFIFGYHAVLVWYGYRQGWYEIVWDASLWVICLEVIALFFWNELHFFLSHRLLHTPLLFRNVHYQHHLSRRPTPFAAFSFHWIEALLLGAVMNIAVFFYDFSIYGLLSLPIMSLIFNVTGHSYMRFSDRTSIFSFSTRHSAHHFKTNINFGFAITTFDRLLGGFIKNTKTEEVSR
jgi:sterol desaturase/sphingolipid hydroxylase (fatty acid hydroxylase superfamily)